MTFWKMKIVFALFAAGAFTPSVMAAVIWSEQGDAGQTRLSAQSVLGAGSLIEITGSIGSSSDVDMYWIQLTGGGTFSASAPSLSPSLRDPQLFLFDFSGFGIYANDDGLPALGAFLPAAHPLTPTSGGLYLLAISGYNTDPISVGGLIFPSSPFAPVYGPSGSGGGSPLSGWTGGGDTGSYTVSFTGAQAVETPEPSTTLFISIGLAVLVLSYRRRLSLS